MKRNLRFYVTLLLIAVASVGWAQESVFYTLTPANGSNNSYAGNCDIEIGGVTWNLTGNSTMNPWRIGGKNITGIDRTVYSKNAMTNATTKVELEVGAASSITVNSLKLIVASDEKFSNKLDEVTATFTPNNTITFTPTTGTEWATGAYYKFIFNVTVSVNSNKFVEFKSARFYKKASTLIAPNLSFSSSTATANLGETFTAPTLNNPNNLTVTYDSSDPTVATVDENTGAVTLVAAGTTTITATFAGNDEYEAGNASYTLTVVDPNAPGAQNNPYTVAQARTAIDNGTGVNGVYATGIVSAIVTEYNSQFGNITYDISTDGTTESAQLRAYRGKSFNGDNFTSADDIKVGDQVVIYGNLTKYQDIYEFAQDNRLISLVRPQAPAGLAYATTEVAKNLGDAAFTNELTNPNNLTVTYSSSDPAVATVNAENGEVTLVGEGTTTITANSAETAEYLAGTASYTLTVTNPTVYVAQIGTTQYATLEEAFAAAQDGETITLLSDCAGNGIIAPQGKFTTGLTVNFAGFTYTIDGSTLAGSTGTKTQAFQLLKDNTITFKNGAIVGNTTGLKMLIQNYSNLTLDNMVLDATQGTNSVGYVLSTNNGSTTIKDTQITAKTGGMAFDACSGWGNYQSNSVEVVGNSVINGDVEVSYLGRTPGQPATLTLTAGTLNGNIVMAQGADQCTVTKANTFTQDAPAGYVWKDNGNGTSTLAKAVAQIGTTNYVTLEEAFAAAQDGETITLLSDCAGNGIKAPQGKFATGLTVNFAGFTYTVDGETVGSTGTETNGFQLLKDNKITFQNGTITSTKAKILVQNYSDLTLNNMTLTLNNPDYTGAYTLSNNNGNTVINGSTINANPAGGFAFDVCRYANYPSVSVTVTGNSQINGNVEVYAGNSDPKDGFKLLLESGTLTGDIVLDQTAKNAMESNPDKAEVTKNNTFNQTAPEGYEWRDNGDGTSTLVKSILVLTLNETEDNSAVLDANNGKVADVTIGRSFVNTSYQTLSLPFDLTLEQVEAVFGTSTRVQSFINAVTDAEENIVLNFEAATGIEAGKPYLILPLNNVENPTFTGVTVSNATAQTVTGEQADFIANINATEYAANEQQMYLGADNKLYFNNTTATMKGFRAYFMLKGTTPGKTVGFSFDGTPTGITTITGNTNANVNGWYTLDGQKLNAAPTQKGIYINNGRKVVIK